MALINDTYFLKRLTAVPNLKDAVLDDLNSYISVYEPEYLNAVLGADLKDDFEAGLIPATPDQKWLDLRDGAEFEYEDVKYKWIGFNNVLKESPISFYIFWHFMRDNNVLFTGIGTVLSNSENSNRVSPLTYLVTVWNRMAKENEILEKFLLANEEDYSNYAPFDTLTETINVYGI